MNEMELIKNQKHSQSPHVEAPAEDQFVEEFI